MAGAGSGGYIPQIWRPQISGSGRCPKWVVQKKADFRTAKIGLFSGPRKNGPFLRPKKTAPKKGPKKGRFLGPGK